MVNPSPAADPWMQLSGLRTAAQKQADARTAFAVALRDFHAAGWTYRQLGHSAGISHEAVRLAILGLPADSPASGIEIPERPRSLHTIPLQEMDPGVTNELKSSLAAAIEAEPTARTGSGIKPAVADYFAALHRAADAGWDVHSLAIALNSHPKAVFKFIAHQERYGEGSAPALAPAPPSDEPTLWRARRPSVPLVRIPDAVSRELQRLEPGAFGDSAEPCTTEQYLALLGEWYLRGANRQELECATEHQWETVRKRLVRAGFMAGKPRTTRRRVSQP